MIKLSDYVMEFIAKQGVKDVFLLSGGGCMHLVDSLGKCKDLNYICNLNEQAVGIAVEAYGQYTNNLGVGLVTTGPGGTNAITGVAAAYVDSTPCLILSGQVKRSDLAKPYGVRQMGYQEVDIVSIVKPITKYSVIVMEPEKIKYYLQKAVYLATNGKKGPVWIDIPLDVQAAMIDENHLEEFVIEKEIQDNTCSDIEEKIKNTIKLLNEAKRPCILVGNGVRLSNAGNLFLDLVKKLNIPVLATWKAIDFFDENDPLFFGRPGAIGQRGANFIQQNCDFLLVIGARLDFGQTGYNHKNFAPKAKKIMLDIDKAEINKMDMDIQVKAHMDAKVFIEEFLKQVSSVEIVNRDNWFDYCNKMKSKYPVILKEYWQQEEYVNSYAFIDILSELLNKNDLIVPGSSGSCSEITMQGFKVKKGQRLFNNEGFGAMGFGLPASIGACIASNGKRTICINGDGGFQLNIQELETVRRLNLPIKFFIINNDGYGAITNSQRNHFNCHYVASEKSSGLTLADVCKVANAYDVKSIRIYNNNELKEKVKEVLEYEGPVVCDVMVHPTQPTAPKLMSEKLPDGNMISKPLEDLWPFLDREEFCENMLK
jgi:acetolactate synthase-1/2/3 large subunit